MTKGKEFDKLTIEMVVKKGIFLLERDVYYPFAIGKEGDNGVYVSDDLTATAEKLVEMGGIIGQALCGFCEKKRESLKYIGANPNYPGATEELFNAALRRRLTIL